ncbi:MAG: alpha/beta hydrolase [Bacillota bacterium]|nr:alpha/beta hydrolase [Bacillota bacterium]
MALSIAAVLANGFLYYYPDKVKSLVLAGPIYGFKGIYAERLQLLYDYRDELGDNAFYRLFSAISIPQNLYQPYYPYIRGLNELGRDEVEKWLTFSLQINDFYELFHKGQFNIPILLVLGERDEVFLQTALDAAASSDSYTIKIIDSLHACNLEQPDLFNEIALWFYLDHLIIRRQ